MKTIQEFMTDIADQSESIEVRAYSGRGMYGRNCVAITGTNNECMSMIGEVIKMAASEMLDQDDGDTREFDLLVENLMSFSMDSMGYDVVIYWPREQWVNTEEEQEDDSEE